jgi:hypothetical protein
MPAPQAIASHFAAISQSQKTSVFGETRPRDTVFHFLIGL